MGRNLSDGYEIVDFMRAEQYSSAASSLNDFLSAFNELVPELQPISASYNSSFPRWQARPGRETRVDQLRVKVASLAGPAAEALAVSGAHIDYKPPGTWQRQPINPALVWSTIFDDTPMLDPNLLNVVALQALGLLEHRRDEQAARQKGFIGAIAWFFTLAPRVREAAGLPPRSAPGVAVTSITVLIQGLIVTVVGGALVYPLANAMGWIE